MNVGNIFQSTIEIKKANFGISIISTVYVGDNDNAYKVALLFIGKMLDVLSLKINTPLNLNMHDAKLIAERGLVKAIIVSEEFIRCFDLSRSLNLHHPQFMRALNWYRKGLYTDDPFDKFLAFWNSISGVAGFYHIRDERTASGIVYQIWSCFKTLWGAECAVWPIINGDTTWVKINNDIRNNIAHGTITVEIDQVTTVSNRLTSVQTVAYNFLSQWAELQLNISII